jgi:uncharacterized protein with ATP-grasp and redox domains
MTNTNTAAGIEIAQNDKRCVECQYLSFERLMNKFDMPVSSRVEFKSIVDNTLIIMPQSITVIHAVLNREFCRLLGNDDPYRMKKTKAIKLRYNFPQVQE